ncbi:hypothetical protein AAHC03_010001 [Spirometra sp. Aus1]
MGPYEENCEMLFKSPFWKPSIKYIGNTKVDDEVRHLPTTSAKNRTEINMAEVFRFMHALWQKLRKHENSPRTRNSEEIQGYIEAGEMNSFVVNKATYVS